MIKTGLVLLFDEADIFLAKQLEPVPVDYIGIHPWGGNLAIEGLERTLQYIHTPAYKEFTGIMHGSGKQIEFEAHVHSWLFPKDLFSGHPQWFRENLSGQRTADYNMCISNKEALAYLADRAGELAKLLVPDNHKYYWWTDDVREDCFCHCSGCRELSPSDQYLVWCNTVLSGIRKTDADASLCYLAYLTTMPAPKKVKPAAGIFLEYAPIQRDSFIPINHRDCEKNRSETCGLPELLSCFGSKDSRVLEYWLDNSRFSLWAKPWRKLQFDPEIMSRDVAYYRSLKFESMTTFACWLGKEYQQEYSPPDFMAYTNILKIT
jgi:hypothetical protein